MTATPEIDNLVESLLRDPDSLSEDQLNTLAKHPLINKYSIVNKDGDTKTNVDGEPVRKQAFFSYSNLQEDYMSRVEMTSLVGFVYRMYKEYEIDPDDASFIDERRVDTKELDTISTQPYDVPKIEGMIKKLNNIVVEIKSVKEMIEKLKYKFVSLELEDKKPTDEDKAILEQAVKSHTAMSYALIQLLIDYGLDAGNRVHNVIQECRKYKDVVEEINKMGIRLPPKPEQVFIPKDVAKNLIKKFLDKYFEYDPDEHVKSAIDKKLENSGGDYDQFDPSRPTMKFLKAAAEHPEYKDIYNDRQTYNACMHLLQRPELLEQLHKNREKMVKDLTKINTAVELVEHIPPADTFHRWNYYKEVNMEEIRNVVNAVYHEKPLFEFMVNIYDVVEGTSEELEAERKKFAARYNEELSSDLNVAELGKWTVLANYKKNREKIDFYNRHTEVLKRIMEQHENDKKLGQDLMKKRVTKAKSKNIEKEGKDAEILAEYKKQVSDLSTLGATKVLSAEERRAIEDAKKAIKDIEEVADAPEDSIQVNTFTHDTKTGTMVKGKVYTQAEDPPTQDQIEETLKKSGGGKALQK